MLKRAAIIYHINRRHVEIIFLDYNLKGGGFLVSIYGYFSELWSNPGYSTISSNGSLKSPAHQGKLILTHTHKKKGKKKSVLNIIPAE